MEKSSQPAENNKKKKNVRKNKNTEPETEVTTNYKQWTTRETEKLLELLVEATLEKKKDTSGCFTKRIVEEEILPKLNQACGCDKSFENYKGKHRWLKTRFGQYQDLFKSCTSGFGWDDANKMITGSDEMWNNYFEVCVCYLLKTKFDIFFFYFVQSSNSCFILYLFFVC